jgi:death-on-curing protein
LPSEPHWLKPAEVIAICRDAVSLTGEPFLLHRGELLLSALARPQNHWAYGEEDMRVLAVMLLLGIGQNHPFEQGNKRTALIAAAEFLEINGYRFSIDDSDFFGEIIRDAIDKKIEEDEFIKIMRTFIEPILE